MCAKLAHYLSQQLFQETNHITFRNLKKKPSFRISILNIEHEIMKNVHRQ